MAAVLFAACGRLLPMISPLFRCRTKSGIVALAILSAVPLTIGCRENREDTTEKTEVIAPTTASSSAPVGAEPIPPGYAESQREVEAKLKAAQQR